jgi:hypothetical protein
LALGGGVPLAKLGGSLLPLGLELVAHTL